LDKLGLNKNAVASWAFEISFSAHATVVVARGGGIEVDAAVITLGEQHGPDIGQYAAAFASHDHALANARTRRRRHFVDRFLLLLLSLPGKKIEKMDCLLL
jgi:hypothetical protein